MAKALATKNPVSERMRSIRRVLWVILVLNLAVAAAKYVYGLMSGSASMQADGIHSVFDSAGNVVGLVGIALAARPADDSHPYGHAKFETYASLVIGVLLLLAAFEVGSSAVGKLVSGVYTAEVTPVSFIVMVGTLAVNIGVTTYERRCAKRLKSEVLAADANHTLSDALVSIGVIVGLAAVALGFPMADPTRGTEGEVYADLHVLVAPGMTVGEAHELSERVERAIMQRFPNVIEVLVHIEPNDGHED